MAKENQIPAGDAGTAWRAALRGVPLFAGLSDGETDAALALLSARRTTYARGAYLLHMGEPVGAFGLVLAGRVEVATDDFEGRAMLMAAVGPGETFAESMAYLGVSASPVYITAPEGATILWLSPGPLHADGGAPDAARLRLAGRFSAMLATRCLSMNDRIQTLCKPSIREKLRAFFTAWERRAGSATFRIPLDRAALAAYLGVNRTALSRELSCMAREGEIEYYRNTFRLLHHGAGRESGHNKGE